MPADFARAINVVEHAAQGKVWSLRRISDMGPKAIPMSGVAIGITSSAV